MREKWQEVKLMPNRAPRVDQPGLARNRLTRYLLVSQYWALHRSCQ